MASVHPQGEVFLGTLSSTRSIMTSLEGTLAEQNRPFNDVFTNAAGYAGRRYLWGIHAAHGQPSGISYRDTSATEWFLSQWLADTLDEPQVEFYLLSASWLVDWNWRSQPETPDGFMRACLSTATNGLAALWTCQRTPPAGPWRMELLGLGYHLGAALQRTLTVNLDQSSRAVYVLGDPTLCSYVTAPASNLTAVTNGFPIRVSLSWTGSPEASAGYYACRGLSLEDALTNTVWSLPVGSTNFTDNAPMAGQTNVYLLRAAQVIDTGGGSFTNLSRAVWTSVRIP